MRFLSFNLEPKIDFCQIKVGHLTDVNNILQ